MLIDGGNPAGEFLGLAGTTGEDLPPKRKTSTVDRQRDLDEAVVPCPVLAFSCRAQVTAAADEPGVGEIEIDDGVDFTATPGPRTSRQDFEGNGGDSKTIWRLVAG